MSIKVVRMGENLDPAYGTLITHISERHATALKSYLHLANWMNRRVAEG